MQDLDKLWPDEPLPKSESYVDELVSMFGVTQEDVAGMKETEFLYKQVLPRGHLIALVGIPGAGKTTILEYVAGQIQGTVLYINADISSSDTPEAHRRSLSGGYALLAPDIKAGLSVDDVILKLNGLAVGEDDLSDVTFIIDTLKKITDVINKTSSKQIYKMLRALTGRGATVICLGHCNKYPDQNGWPVYEGTSDLRSDFDELALLHAHKGDYGQVTSSLYWAEQGCPWAKSRAFVEAQSWSIDVEDNRVVSELSEWVDTVTLSKEKHEAIQTADVIHDIHQTLTMHGPMSQSDIVKRMTTYHGKRIILRVLKQQAGKSWTITTGEHNAQIHTAIADAKLPTVKAALWGQQS